MPHKVHIAAGDDDGATTAVADGDCGGGRRKDGTGRRRVGRPRSPRLRPPGCPFCLRGLVPWSRVEPEDGVRWRAGASSLLWRLPMGTPGKDMFLMHSKDKS